MIVDNSQIAPFTLKGPIPMKRNLEAAKNIRQLSRLTYGRPRAEVEAEIAERAQIGTRVAPFQSVPFEPMGG